MARLAILACVAFFATCVVGSERAISYLDKAIKFTVTVPRSATTGALTLGTVEATQTTDLEAAARTTCSMLDGTTVTYTAGGTKGGMTFAADASADRVFFCSTTGLAATFGADMWLKITFNDTTPAQNTEKKVKFDYAKRCTKCSYHYENTSDGNVNLSVDATFNYDRAANTDMTIILAAGFTVTGTPTAKSVVGASTDEDFSKATTTSNPVKMGTAAYSVDVAHAAEVKKETSSRALVVVKKGTADGDKFELNATHTSNKILVADDKGAVATVECDNAQFKENESGASSTYAPFSVSVIMIGLLSAF